jgi:hypothetical protein
MSDSPLLTHSVCLCKHVPPTDTLVCLPFRNGTILDAQLTDVVVAVARTGKCPGIPLETFSKVVESIYDCAFDPNRWQGTVSMIAELSRSQVCGFVITGEGMHKNLSIHVGVEEQYVRLYEETYAALNPHLGPLQLLPVGEVITTPMILDEREFLESRFYQEFLKPQALRDAIGFNVLKTPQRVGALAATRLESQGHFDAVEVRLFSLLAPHVCRSIAISDALNLKTIKSEALEATLDALRPAFI